MICDDRLPTDVDATLSRGWLFPSPDGCEEHAGEMVPFSRNTFNLLDSSKSLACDLAPCGEPEPLETPLCLSRTSSSF
jgi:hypothetical protein